jgi:acetylornithine deacetylase/succinyl-diaminopimelate desuccinylase-like protein
VIEDDVTARVVRDLEELARPRMTGTPSEEALRTRVAGWLGAAGCTVREEAFHYDPFWARHGYALLLGVSALALGVGAIGPDPLLAAIVAVGIALPVVLVAGSGTPRVDRRPRRRAMNLVATLGEHALDRPLARPDTPRGAGDERGGTGSAPRSGPDVVLMAHLDSKSQRVSFAARSALAAMGGIGAVCGLVLAATGTSEPIARAFLGAGAIGLGVLGTGGSGNASPGALDNATGVAALVELVRRFAARRPSRLRVAAVITTAEEDGLVGAHRFAEAHGDALGGAVVVNLDTLGPGRGLHLLVHERRPDPTGPLGRATSAIIEAAAGCGVPVARRRVPFPAGVDSHPIARRGIAALSLASGGLGDTFRHLHRPSDALERVDPRAILRAVDVVEEAVRRLDR